MKTKLQQLSNTSFKIFHCQIFFQLKSITVLWKFLKLNENKVVNKEENWTRSLIHDIYYWLLFFENDNFKYATTSRLTYNSFSLFHIFYLIMFLFIILFKLSCNKKYHVYNLYRLSYTFSFCYVMDYIVLEICIGGRFSENCFYRYFYLL